MPTWRTSKERKKYDPSQDSPAEQAAAAAAAQSPQAAQAYADANTVSTIYPSGMAVPGPAADGNPATPGIDPGPSPEELAAELLSGTLVPGGDHKSKILSGLLDAPVPQVGGKDKLPELPKLTGDPAKDVLSTRQRTPDQKGPSLKDVIDRVSTQASKASGLELGPDEVQAIARSAARHGVDPADLTSIYEIETGFGQNEGPSSAGAVGKMQFMPQTWEEYGKGRDPSNVYAAMDAAGRYLKSAGYKQGDPSAEDQGIFAYNHAGWYVDDVQQGADKYEPIWNKAAKQAPQLGREGKGGGGKLADVVGEDGSGLMVKVRADAKGMVKWAENVQGISEGSSKQLNWASKFGLGSTEPWCANFISNGLIRRGITDLPSNPNYVPSYENEWGQYALPGGLLDAKPGDLVTFGGSHIGLYVGNGEMISGNSSDAVSRTPVGEPSMVIRPPYQGGTVELPESALSIPAEPGTSEELVSGGGSESPLIQAAMERTSPDASSQPAAPSGPSRGEMIMELLNAPTPSVSDPTSVLDDEDELMKLIMRRLA